MKIYSGYPGGITKITNGKDFYQTEDLSNVITVYVDKTNLTGITYSLTLEFLRADNRKTTLIPQAFEVGDDTTLTEDGVTYDIHNFVLTDSQLAVAGALAFTCYITIFNNSNVVVSRGALFNAVSNVRKTVTYSANTIFVVSEDDEDVPIILADMKTAIETLAGQLASKVNKADVADNLTTNDSDKVLSAKQGYILKAMLDALEAATYTKTEVDSALSLKADKATTYTKSEVYNKTEIDGKLDLKANAESVYNKTEIDDKLALKANSNDTYTRTVINSMVATLASDKANKNETYTKTEVDTTTNEIFGMLYLVEGAINKLESVQNVVDVVATKSALNSYDTSKLEENDKIQVIADETHGGASTIYNWNGSAWQYVGAYGTNSYTKPETIEQIDLHKLVNKTYSELATLKANNGLVAGQLYRITDYVTTTNGKCNNISNDVRSMEHPFDVIVRAITNNKFSEEARAINHSGDSYFANSDLKAWRLWYCFENDSVRFEWADTTNGKGVIYRMIDEFGNDLPYDFKNIQFKRYKITATSDQRQALFVGKYLGFSGNYAVVSDNSDYVWHYTFSKRSDGSDLSLTETTASDIANSYYVKQVIIGQYLTDTPNYRGAQALNNIVMEADNIIVDVQMGAGSHHNTWIGNKDIDYCYFREMFRQNILFGEINHTRADECFERNVMGEGHYSNYTSCWNKFSHHFSQNTSLNLQSNDFENQVGNCKFPEHFTRNHVSNMWDNVNAGTHDTFNRCEFGYMVDVTLSGAGDWDSVKTIMCYNVTIKIANLYGSVFNRMEYVILSQNNSVFNIANLTVGAIYGSSSKILNIALGNLVNRDSVYEKRIDWAYNTGTENKSLIYTFASYDATNYIMDNYSQIGTIGDDGTVTWDTVTKFFTKIDNIKMNKTNPTGTGTISMNSGTASNYGYANGSGANASGMFSKAVGFGAQASGSYSIAIVGNASGSGAIAIGNMANASGDTSKALGTGTKAKGDNQTVTGKFNIPDTTSLEIVGNGAYMNTKNARLLDSNGNEYLAGNLYINTTFTKDGNGDLSAKNGTKITDYVDNAINDLRWELGSHTLDVESDTDVAFSKSVPNYTIGCQINKIGGMSRKCTNLLNLADGENGFINDSGSVVYRTVQFASDYIQVFSGKTYIVKTSQNFNNIGVAYYDTSKNILLPRSDNSTVSQVTISPSANGYIRIWFNVDNTTNLTSSIQETYSIMLNEGSTALPYEPYFSGIRDSAVTSVVSKGANLLNLQDVAETTTNGITYKVENGVINLSGTASAQTSIIFNLSSAISNIGYYANFGTARVSSGYASFQLYSNNNLVDYISLNTSTKQLSNISANQVRITINVDTVLTSGTIIPMLVKGSTAPSEYKPYVTPIIKNIPSEIQALTGWGWGINDNCYNYIDFDRKVFVKVFAKKVTRINLGDLFYSLRDNNIFSTLVGDYKYVNGTPALCKNYVYKGTTSSYSDIKDVMGDMELYIYYQSGQSSRVFYFRNTDYSDATAFKTAMNGIYLYYELETPIETDISAYLTDDTIDVEPNGTLEFTNTYSQDVPSDIDYLIEEVKA